MENELYTSIKYPHIYIVSSSFDDVQVTIASVISNFTFNNITVPPASVRHIPFPDEFRNYGTGIFNTGVLIESSDDVAVFGLNDQKLSPSVFLVYPVQCLGMIYFILTSYPTTLKCQFLIATTDDNTNIEITFANGPNANSVLFNGTEYSKGETMLLQMHNFETLQIQSTGDLTGTKVVSNKRLAIYSGNIKTNMFGATSNSDNLAIQLPPVDTWGRYFVAVRNPVTGIIGFLKYVSSTNGTNITYHCVSNISIFSEETFLLPNAGDSILLQHDHDSCYIWANRPVLVVQVTMTINPSMIAVSPLEQYATEYFFTRPYHLSNYFQHTLSLVVQFNNTVDVLLNGSPLTNNITYSRIPGTNFVTGSMELNDNYQNLTIASYRKRFWAMLLGYKKYETYAVNVGMKCCNIYLVSIIAN